CSAAALLIGGLYLLAVDAITWEIPVACIAAFSAFIAVFGGQGFSGTYILANLLGGGIIMGAFFMATDPVTSPVTSTGQLIYGASIGIIAALFRVFATAADSVSYAIIIGNLFTPLIDEYIVPLPFGLRKGATTDSPMDVSFDFRKYLPAVRLCIITLLAGLGLAGVYNMTKGVIEEQQLAKQRESYLAVLPGAEDIGSDDTLKAAVEAVSGKTYGTDFGKAFINDAVVGLDASGNVVGYVVNATSSEGFDGNISLSVGVDKDGVVQGIAFTELNETAGMGMRCDEPAFKDQFAGKQVSKFVLNKAGGSTADDEIDSVSGASISSGAVVNAVNAGLDFLKTNVK
ncbi:MAG: RnfABCDGE type electron transport complex subunit D, partial [Lachnospiraceae bacterium]|nr:RnfABCDGE type electron transport complex subunit D [Lachnospiraceae bacterium]